MTIKGKGFNPDGGGFSSLIINDVEVSCEEIELLHKQLAEVVDECGEYACENNGLKQQLAECQAQVKQAKREAVLMVANWVEPQRNIIPATGEEFAAAIRIAKELET